MTEKPLTYMDVPIESGIPIPTPNRQKSGESSLSRFGQAKYPFHKLEVGDSFLIPCEEGEKHSYFTRINRSSQKFIQNKDPSVRFARRMVEGGIRVWRIA